MVEANNIVWVSGLVGMFSDGTIPSDTLAQFDVAMSDWRLARKQQVRHVMMLLKCEFYDRHFRARTN